MLGGPSTAQAHLVTPSQKSDKLSVVYKKQTANLKHARYVCNNGRKTWTNTKWHCHATKWLPESRERTWKLLHPTPVFSAAWLRANVEWCKYELVRRETADTFDPGIWNGQGSGAFGLPQALPFSKMPKAAWPREYGGSENPWVQLAWMDGYVADRYGSYCNAIAFHNANNYY